MHEKITASLVLYNADPEIFESAIFCFFKSLPTGILVVVDNSSSPTQSEWFEDPRIEYVYLGKNVGFGAGHNLAFKYVEPISDFHLILNPDIIFGEGVLPRLVQLMSYNGSIGAVMPQIRFRNGELQRLCKLLPTPLDLIVRRFIPIQKFVRMLNVRYELHGLPQDTTSVIPSLSGCFLLVRSRLFAKLNGFDERYFMYLEDVDLVRRIGDHSNAVYEPSVYVIHGYEKGSYKSRKLLGYHLKSAFRYFNKWGWFLDKVRVQRNNDMLTRLKGLTVKSPVLTSKVLCERTDELDEAREISS